MTPWLPRNPKNQINNKIGVNPIQPVSILAILTSEILRLINININKNNTTIAPT